MNPPDCRILAAVTAGYHPANAGIPSAEPGPIAPFA